jgi:hypothetical protein
MFLCVSVFFGGGGGAVSVCVCVCVCAQAVSVIQVVGGEVGTVMTT